MFFFRCVVIATTSHVDFFIFKGDYDIDPLTFYSSPTHFCLASSPIPLHQDQNGVPFYERD